MAMLEKQQSAITITDQIASMKAKKITEKSMGLQSLVKIDTDQYVLMNTRSIASKYRKEIQEKATLYKLNDRDAHKYDYRPDKFCYDYYGTIEMVPFILLVNNMVSKIEFTNLDKGIYILSTDVVETLNEILRKEERTLRLNRAEIDEELK